MVPSVATEKSPVTPLGTDPATLRLAAQCLYNGHWVSFPGVKRPERGVNHPLPSSAEVKASVDLHLYSSGPLWPVPGRSLALPVQRNVF
jgi:hypothetical protein